MGFLSLNSLGRGKPLGPSFLVSLGFVEFKANLAKCNLNVTFQLIQRSNPEKVHEHFKLRLWWRWMVSTVKCGRKEENKRNVEEKTC